MKALLLALLKQLAEYLVRRFITQQQHPEKEEKPTYEEDTRAMDKALAGGDADSVTLMFDRLLDDIPPNAGNTGDCNGNRPGDTGGQDNPPLADGKL